MRVSASAEPLPRRWSRRWPGGHAQPRAFASSKHFHSNLNGCSQFGEDSKGGSRSHWRAMTPTVMNPVKAFTLLALGLAIGAIGIYSASFDDAPGAPVGATVLM